MDMNDETNDGQASSERMSSVMMRMLAKGRIDYNCKMDKDEGKPEETTTNENFPKRHKHLFKIIHMFLATLFWSHLQAASCQLQSLNYQTGSNLHKTQHPNQRQRSAANQFRINGQQHFYPQSFHHNHQQLPLAADRRVASGAAAGSQQAKQAHLLDEKSDNAGRLLVCYYTSAGNGASPWPPVKEGREFVIPADSLNSIQTEAMLLSQPLADFATGGSHYNAEPFTNTVGNLDHQGIHANQMGLLGKRPNNIKNQQQPLFKLSSAQSIQAPINVPRNQLAVIGKSPSSESIVNNRKTKQHQESHMIATRADHLGASSPAASSAAAAAAAAASSFSSFVFHPDRSHKSKQTPAYNFVEGDLDAGGALIVSGPTAGSGSVNQLGQTGLPIGPESQQQQQQQQQPQQVLLLNGNNGANFVTAATGGQPNRSNNNGNHPERNPSRQQQQLVFSPPSSQSRAFIVNSSNNNEILDTKSQLLFPSTLASSLTSPLAPTTSSTGLYQQPQEQQKQRAKNLQFQQQLAEQLPPQQQLFHQASLFSGTVSSSPPVPLSTASIHHHNQLQQQQHHYQHHHQLDNSASSRNLQLLAAPPAAGSNQRLPAGSQSKSTLEPLSGTSAGATSKGPFVNGLPSLGTGSSSGEILQQVATNQQQNVVKGGQLELSELAPVEQASTSLVGGALSSVLVSSPLSSVFDAFGAAGQYLMRFKPSSLISPSSLASFGAISQEPNQQIQQLGNSSKVTNGGNSADNAAYMIPLPFSSSGLISSKPQTTSPAPLNDGSSAAGNSEGNSLLSRLSFGQSSQRREDVCGRTIQTPQRRIIGGEGARYGEFPYQVHIKIAKHQCGGALVDRQSIVTAAHCVYHFITRAPVSKLQIVIGAYDIEDEQYQELPPQYFKVNKVKLHPNFRFSASHPDRYDIAILKLDKPVKYTDNVLPVCLPSKDLKLESMVGTVTGFGKTDPSLSNRYGTRLLQKVDVPIIENNECERWHRTRGIDLKIFPEMMCAGYEDGLKDACVGDSGGPLVVKTAPGPNGSYRWTLAGITSAGFGCAQSRQPGIYHRVSHTVDWILENLD